MMHMSEAAQGPLWAMIFLVISILGMGIHTEVTHRARMKKKATDMLYGKEKK